MMYAVRFTSKFHNGWKLCIENGAPKTFTNKAAAEKHAAKAAKTMKFCFPEYEYIYEVVEVK